MRKLNQTLIILLTLIIGTSNLFAADNAVTDRVNQYLSALSQKESTAADNCICNEANFTMFNNIVGEKEHFNKEDFLKQLQNGDVGVWAKKSEIKDVKVSGNLAVVYLESEIKNLSRQEYLTLVNSEGNWEIVSSVSSLSKK